MNAIVVNIGNTRTTVALARGERIGRRVSIPSHGATPQAAERAIRRVLGRARADGSIVASVVPACTARWCRALKRVTGIPALRFSSRLDLGFRIRYPRPATIGADRLANAAGAIARHGVPVIIADAGTALTVDLVDAGGAFIGGVIAPGMRMMTDYLADRTALLPRIRAAGACPPVGRSTAVAMRIGAIVGYRGLVRAIVEHVQAGPGARGATLCATGGDARRALAGSGIPFKVDRDLTLVGLARVLARQPGTVP